METLKHIKNVKILQVCAIDESVEALLKPLIRKSMNHGFEVHNACTDTGRFARLQRDGLIMKNIKIDRSINPISNLKSILDLYKLMRTEKYDIVHVHTPIAALLGRIAAKMAKVPTIIYTAHGFYFHDEMDKKTYNLFVNIEKYAAKYLTDWLLLQSKEDYEFAIHNKFKSKDKIIHISNGVDIWSKFHPTVIDSEQVKSFTLDNNVTDKDFVFSFIGRLVKEKGIFELLSAFSRINKIHPNTKLIVIGDLSASERDKASTETIDSYKSNQNIIFTGYRRDTPTLVAASDVYVLPSYREGLPRSIIEAMALHKPVIASNIRGCREEVFHMKNGVLVEKENDKSLFEAMNFLIENPNKVEQFGEYSRILVEELFDEEKVIQKQLDLFDITNPKASKTS